MIEHPASELGAKSVRVVKLGGSLLAWPDWPLAFHEWHCQPHSQDVLIVGGGSRVNELRTLDQQIGLGQSSCHAIAIRMMTANAHRVARRLGVRVVSAVDPNHVRCPLCVLDVECFNAQQPLTDRQGQRLPKHWDVTSDSLAAAVAHQLNADELVLLKSTSPPPIHEWQDAKFVDPMFASSVSRTLEISAVNLRKYGPVPATTDVAFSVPHPIS